MLELLNSLCEFRVEVPDSVASVCIPVTLIIWLINTSIHEYLFLSHIKLKTTFLKCLAITTSVGFTLWWILFLESVFFYACGVTVFSICWGLATALFACLVSGGIYESDFKELHMQLTMEKEEDNA